MRTTVCGASEGQLTNNVAFLAAEPSRLAALLAWSRPDR